ncbi:MAG: glycosyltransferase family 39 protein [Anaerolineales bacterium]|nr:glycosyltransferase family 39 protein [Anaerolineales bacterium]
MPSFVTLGRRYGYLFCLLLANLSLLLPQAHPLRIGGAILLIGLLPGWLWATRLASPSLPLIRWTIAAGLSYTITCLALLLLNYLSGPISIWQTVITLNIVALIPALVRGAAKTPASQSPHRPIAIPLLLILVISLFLRAANLHYSEFQGDEALAMITAAEALEGHEDALFLRSKGPAEVLLPMAVWRLTGAINETAARLPFTLAALAAIVTIYSIGHAIGGARVGWLAAGFFAFNGFMVAFGRIVQYQALVVWFSALAFLLALEWQTRQQARLALLSGLFLGVGVLAHYDGILVLPAVGWLFLSPALAKFFPNLKSKWSGTSDGPGFTGSAKAIGIFLITFIASMLLFYLPFALDPRANRTGDYVGNRIGDDLRNNLPDFFHFNTFYSSFYYIVLTGLLILFFLVWLSRPNRWSRAIALPAAVACIVVIIKPDLLAITAIDLSFLPFALLFLTAFFASAFIPALLIWLAIPFLGYNFVVALGLTHIYTIVPAWSLLAAFGWVSLIDYLLAQNNTPSPRRWRDSPLPKGEETGVRGQNFTDSASSQPRQLNSLSLTSKNRWTDGLLLVLLMLSTLFFWNAFIRHEVEYWQDYPNGNLALFWTPYQSPPAAGFFGFAHRAGWKAVGQQLHDGALAGDYGSNEEPDVTTWYTRGAPRACDPQPEYYFLAGDLIDPVETPDDLISERYYQVGLVTLPNQKQMRIMQQRPTTLDLGQIDDAALARAFDRTATPAAFARSARGSQPSEATFGSAALGPLVRLVGYDLDTRRAYPGGRVPVTLYWQTLAEFPASYQIFTHLESEAGPVAQSDGVPVCWTYPTDTWRPGQIIADQHALSLSPDLQPGRYPLAIGLYLPDTFERLDRLDVAGNPAGTSLILETVDVRDEKIRN